MNIDSYTSSDVNNASSILEGVDEIESTIQNVGTINVVEKSTEPENEEKEK